MKRLALLVFLPLAAGLAAGQRPILSLMTTCAQLTQNFYPADTTTWFDAAKSPQVVFYAHMLFPLKPELDSLVPPQPAEAWHPPLVIPSPTPLPSAPLSIEVSDKYYAEAAWLDPDGAEVAHFGLTMPARVSADYIRMGMKQYIPHTFTMTLGTKDIRAQAGQKMLPAKAGQYHVRLYVDGQIEGIAFFRMLGAAQSLTPSALPPPAPQAVTPASNLIQDVLRVLTQTGK